MDIFANLDNVVKGMEWKDVVSTHEDVIQGQMRDTSNPPPPPPFHAWSDTHPQPGDSQTRGFGGCNLMGEASSVFQQQAPLLNTRSTTEPAHLYSQEGTGSQVQDCNIPMIPEDMVQYLHPVGYLNDMMACDFAPAAPPLNNSGSIKRKHPAQQDADQPYIKKPPNAFMLFLKEQRPKVVSELNLTESAAVNAIVGQRWKSLSKDQQAKYYQQADKERQLHAKQHPDWSTKDNYGKKRKRVRRRILAAASKPEEVTPQLLSLTALPQHLSSPHTDLFTGPQAHQIAVAVLHSKAQDLQTKSRITKWKASPERTVKNKRIRVTELADPHCSFDKSCIFEGDLRKVRGDGQKPSTKTGYLKLMQYDSMQVSSSVDTRTESTGNSLEGCSYTEQAVSMRKDNRKAAGNGQGPANKKKTSLDQVEPKDHLSVAAQIAEFKAKYMEQEPLGRGGHGCVYAGYRREDHFPVAIKHILQGDVLFKLENEQGKLLPSEVVIMSKLAAGTTGSVETSAPVSLLDWYDLNEELILVLERPVPSMNLLQYREVNGDRLPEEMAKIIMKQLVKAAKELEDKNIFHRDIKLENILIETGSDVPRVRLIDFGLSCFADHQSLFRVFYGTAAYMPPEFFIHSSYKFGPSTVWQLGVVLYELFYNDFETIAFLKFRLTSNKNLSESCQDFLRRCLTINLVQRPKLEELLLHPWLQ